MAKQALIVWGGWDGHEPEKVANIFGRELRNKGFEVEVSSTLDSLLDGEKLKRLALFVPCWTCGKLSDAQGNNIVKAVAGGIGIAGCHGGMCDAFREHTEWQFMTGGQWVSHPGNEVSYTVNIKDKSHFITKGIKDFQVKSEQYYMHVDPVVKVLATTKFPVGDGPHVPNGECHMPVIWTKMYGQGRVAYTSLGHNAKTFDIPEALTTAVRCLLWAAKAEN